MYFRLLSILPYKSDIIAYPVYKYMYMYMYVGACVYMCVGGRDRLVYLYMYTGIWGTYMYIVYVYT